jgi:hypothetical protein
MRWAGQLTRIGRRGMHIGFWWESQKERDLDAVARIMSKWILRKIGWDVKDWVDLAQDMDQWRALVKVIINLRAP